MEFIFRVDNSSKKSIENLSKFEFPLNCFTILKTSDRLSDSFLYSLRSRIVSNLSEHKLTALMICMDLCRLLSISLVRLPIKESDVFVVSIILNY